MTTMNRGQARVIDPVLSSVALGYGDPEFIGSKLFPEVVSPAFGARVIRFGKEEFLQYQLRRAPGSKTQRVQFGYAADPIALVQDSLEGKVPREFLRDAAQVPNIDLASRAVRNTMRIVRRALEIEQAGIAQNTANYDANHRVALAGTDRWDNAGSSPRTQMNAYREAIRSTIGTYPNVLELPAKAFSALADHAQLRDQFKYTDAKSLTPEMLAAYFGVDEVVIGKSVYADSETSAFTDVWSSAVLAYVPTQDRAVDVPSYGYTYYSEGHPLVEEPYFEKNEKSWIYPVEFERRPYVTGLQAGFLIQTPVAP